MGVCQKCGDKGDTKRLVYCNKCHVSLEHSYCLDILPMQGSKEVIWTCEECSPRVPKPSCTSIKSARISQAVEFKLNRIKMRKQASLSRVNAQANRNADRLIDAKKTRGDCSPKEDIQGLPSSCDGSTEKEIERLLSSSPSVGDKEFRKRKRRLVLEDGNSDEEFESVNCSKVDDRSHLDPFVGDHSLNISHMSYSDANDCVHAQPTTDPMWRGCFIIQNEKSPNAVGLAAHLSSKACEKVGDAAKQLPMQLNIALFSRSDVWPRKFEIAPPTDESIGLYLFPAYERDEKAFDNLMDHIIIHDQALKAVVNNVELLVFSSRELPPENWRFCSKYYLWGVLKSINNHVLPLV